LKQLDLAGSPVTDVMALELRVFSGLTDLNLTRTSISERALALIDWLPGLRTLNLDGTSIGWWARGRLQRAISRRRREKPDPIFHPVNIR
jgi:hypothetical protein